MQGANPCRIPRKKDDMSPRTKVNTERINVFFNEDTVRELKSQAEIRGMTVSSLIRFIVLEWLRANV